jgi:excisionase family DNA binding protein
MRVQLISIRDAADQLGVSSDTVRRMIQAGLPCVRVHRRVLLDQYEIERVSREGIGSGAVVRQGERGQ